LPSDLSSARLQLIDTKLNFKGCGNSEIMSEWYVLGINSNYKGIRSEMAKFLSKVGRRKYLEPIYETLAQSKDSSDLVWARSVFEKAKNNYHFVSKVTIEDIIY